MDGQLDIPSYRDALAASKNYCAGKRYNQLFFIERPFWIDEIEIEIEIATGKITTIFLSFGHIEALTSL